MFERPVLLAALAAFLFCTPSLMAEQATGDAPVNFARQVQPILSDKCFVCHGPDTRNESELRLDSFVGITEDRGGYRALDPDDPSKSEILSRIVSDDDPMPPPESGKQLTEQERDLISRWILQGGEYTQHWAFIKPKKESVEALPSEFPGKNLSAIDTYVAKRLKGKGLEFAAQADRATLARRVAFVLTGLPPEPDQLHRFLADKSDAAYERLVDEMLASPRFGEHQARYWLDAVRYGDTHGLHLDNRRGIYPYRDWVVRSLNQNLPLDEFIIWQFAGDLLPNPNLAQRVATGYVRLNPSTGEGGAIPDEFQMKNNFDRVETMGTVFLGMSLTCARCHTHKYDPIPQTEYYRLLAFFNSTAEPAMDGNSYTYGPVQKVPADQTAWENWLELSKRRDALLAEADPVVKQKTDLVQYATERSGWSTEKWQITKPVAHDAPLTDKTQWKKGDGLPGAISGRAARGKLPAENQVVWISFDVTTAIDQRLWFKFSGAVGSQVIIDDEPKPVAVKETTEPTAIIPVTVPAGKHQVRLKIVGKKEMSELAVGLHNPWDALAKTKKWDDCKETEQLLMMADNEGPFKGSAMQSPAGELAARLTTAETNFTTTLVAQDLGQPRETRLLQRGEYNLPTGDPLEPGILAVMGEFPADAPRNRLGLARWLTSREHPLVARVLINRIWQRMFGDGLVRTPEDFGLQGQQPTHPQLLDSLAVELHDSGWDLKHMIRLIVTSRTFRQSSVWRDGIDDPENRLLARGPSFRLDAEVLRDVSLWASGLLDPHMGGEGVKPYQPSGMWLAMAHPGSNTKNYVRDNGKRLYRRSLYVYWKRTSPHPMMTLFDAPDRESSCVRRSRTNTSLQSLGLLNEVQRIETARKLAERLIRERNDDADRLKFLYDLIACRGPNEQEKAACEALLKRMQRRYTDADDDALGLLAIGESPRDATLKADAVAAWTQVAVTVLASDAAILLY